MRNPWLTLGMLSRGLAFGERAAMMAQNCVVNMKSMVAMVALL